MNTVSVVHSAATDERLAPEHVSYEVVMPLPFNCWEALKSLLLVMNQRLELPGPRNTWNWGAGQQGSIVAHLLKVQARKPLPLLHDTPFIDHPNAVSSSSLSWPTSVKVGHEAASEGGELRAAHHVAHAHT
jgi:hypothetical protein